MPRDGSGIYSAPPGTGGAPDTTILSSMFNAYVADMTQDANDPRPIGAGGTGAQTAAEGAKNLLSAILTARGDIISRSATVPQRLALGAANSFLASNGTDPAYIGGGEARIALGHSLKVSTKSAAFSALTSNCGVAFVAAGGTWTLSLPAAADCGTQGWFFYFYNNGTGVITIDPNGSELINGGTTQKVFPGDGGVVFTNGSAWYVIGLSILDGSFGNPGYVVWAGGVIEEWSGDLTDAANDSWTMPVAMPNATNHATVTHVNNDTTLTNGRIAWVRGFSQTVVNTAKRLITGTGGPGTTSAAINIRAIGH